MGGGEHMRSGGMCACGKQQGNLSLKYFNNQTERKKQQAEYLELVPNAVARAVNIPHRKVYGFFRVIIK